MAQAWLEKPGPNIWLEVIKPRDRSWTSLNFRKTQSRLELGCFSKKLRLKAGLRDILRDIPARPGLTLKA